MRFPVVVRRARRIALALGCGEAEIVLNRAHALDRAH